MLATVTLIVWIHIDISEWDNLKIKILEKIINKIKNNSLVAPPAFVGRSVGQYKHIYPHPDDISIVYDFIVYIAILSWFIVTKLALK